MLVALRAEIGFGDYYDLGDTGDRLANTLILDRLREQRPGDALLSEEATDDLARLDADRVWIVDPVDGTNEFSTRGRKDWAVHIALIENGTPVHAAVGLPDLGQVFHTGEAKAVTGPMSNKIVVSRTRPPAVGKYVAEKLGRELVPMGSAGAKAMHVLLGDADAYIHAGGQYEWDNCAPAAVAQAAGLHVSRIDGSPLVYNRPDPLLPDLLICRREYAERVLSEVARMHG